jgi:hypothetical protein
VATVGVNERVAFLRRTYGLLGTTLIAWAAFTAGIFHFAPRFSLGISRWALQGNLSWLMVMLLFMGSGMLARHLAFNSSSKPMQYLGLGVGVAAQGLILQPILWILFAKYAGGFTNAGAILGEAVVITLAIFIGLTLTVFITGKDFSFLRGILMIGSFAAIGVIGASLLFGFSLGALFCGALVLLMAGYILMQTSQMMTSFPPTYHVAAALMLFSTIATLFWYVLQLLMQLNRR